jgi:hypothetical protein
MNQPAKTRFSGVNAPLEDRPETDRDHHPEHAERAQHAQPQMMWSNLPGRSAVTREGIFQMRCHGETHKLAKLQSDIVSIRARHKRNSWLRRINNVLQCEGRRQILPAQGRAAASARRRATSAASSPATISPIARSSSSARAACAMAETCSATMARSTGRPMRTMSSM